MRAVIGRLLVLVAAGTVAAVDPSRSHVDRWYSTTVYPRLQHLLTSATNALPVATFDLVLIGVLAWVGWRLGVAAGAVRRCRWAEAARVVLGVAVASAVIYLVFLAFWGLNYRRTPLIALVETAPPPTADAVEQLAVRSAEEMNRGYTGAHQAIGKGLDLQGGPLPAALRTVTAAIGTPAGAPTVARLKTTVIGPYFRWVGIDGMTNPFGLEVLVNPDLLPVEMPFVAAHEWAHLAGFASESDASFVAWLACLKADDASRYSAWLFLYWQLLGELDAATRVRVDSHLAARPREDIRAIAERMRRGRIQFLQEGSWRVYDRYLKANRVQSGVRSYGEVVTLILRARISDDGTPIRRGR